MILAKALDHHQAGRLAEAAAYYRQVLSDHPEQADALHYLGVLEHQAGDNPGALKLLRRSVELRPDSAEFRNNLASVLVELRCLDEAVDTYRSALKIKPDYPEPHNNLGALLTDRGNLDQAETSLQTAIRINPRYAEAHYNLAKLQLCRNRPEDAVASNQMAVRLRPDYAEAHNNLGDALRMLGRDEEAAAAFDRALEIDPGLAEAHSNAGAILKEKGRIADAVAAFRKALEINPDFAGAHSNLILCMNSDPNFSAENILAESYLWDSRHAAPLLAGARSYRNDPDPRRRLRVGYVSPDFRAHSVSHFLEPVMAAHDGGGIEIFCYAEVASPDDMTARYQTLADHWRSTIGKSDHEIADLVRADGIDILVDLAGHTAGNRLLVFAERPAPVQVTYLGYPGTTGMAAMDYRITDAWADPTPRSEAHYVETLIRLPGGFLCYGPRDDAPVVADPPARAAGHITFGSFNNFSKITAAVVDAWAGILRAVPNSRLILKSSSLNLAEAGDRLQALFDNHGIERWRVEILGRMPSMEEHLGLYGKVDIGLDPFPYNGTATTCEALWMGVPVITLAGDRHAARVGTSLLSRIGLDELIATGTEDYVDRAVILANDLDHLAALRAGMRPRMVASSLIVAAAFTREMETAYREVWRKWCEERSSAECGGSGIG